MTELNTLSGLKFELGNKELVYKKEDYLPAIDWIKKFEDGKYAYKDDKYDQNILYFGVRYMEKTVDQELIVKNDLEYDVTVLNRGFVGEEFVKTVGHYHGNVPGLTLSYPEVYEVIDGKIEYLCQSQPDENGSVEVLWIVAEKGDKPVMPPNFGHVSMNLGDELAVESNIQKRDLPKTSDYSMFKEKVGGALYRTQDGLEENPNYKIRSLRIVKPKEVPEWGLTKDTPLYTSMIQNPEKFAFLTRPQDFEFDFDKLYEDIEL